MKGREALDTAAGRRSATAVQGAGRSKPTKPSLRRRLHRNLRGRYLVAFLAVLGGAAAAGVLGWISVEPLYRATASIYVQPVTRGVHGGTDEDLLSLFEGFVASQVELLATGEVARRATETEVWRAAGGGEDPAATQRFEERREVVRVPGTHIVQVAFVDPDPDVSVAGVHALLEAYQERFAELHGDEEGPGDADEQERLLLRRLKEGGDRLQTLTSGLGGVEGLEIRHRAAVRLAMWTEDALRSLPGAADPDVHGQAAVEGVGALPPAAIAAESEQMAEVLAHLARTEAEEKVLGKRLGLTAPSVLELRGRAAVVQEGIEELARDWNRKRAERDAGRTTEQEHEARRRRLVERLEDLQERSRELGRIQGEARSLQAENEEFDRQLVRLQTVEADRAAHPPRRGRVQVSDPGMRPTSPYRDARKPVAALAALLGALLAFSIVLLTGLSDRRLRNAVGADDVLSHVRSLGLLPSLPQDPDDADGARVATHLTHQIRTLLEIAHARDESVCLCVTGPAQGSGKTTLTAALGLSFASTGSRTLLVDADPVGRGLTRTVMRMLACHAGRAGNGAEHSLLEALVPRGGDAATPSPEAIEGLWTDAVRQLGLQGARAQGLVDDLFALADLLDAGAARDRLALRLMQTLAAAGELTSGSPAAWIPARVRDVASPVALLDGTPLERHLYRTGVDTLRFLPLHGAEREGGASVALMAGVLGSLRGPFDVVLVDAGPVPGSDGTSLIAVQSDSVILVVSPEDQGPQAERALAYLDEIGTRVAGVVFNRAGPKDIAGTGRTMVVGHREG